MQINQGSLSAGEKQLLALARAILRRTNIIILDEATSQIDSNLDDQVCCLSRPVEAFSLI
jgi:ABC-type multidrug transport system fused ATPase/permease subunit